MHVWRAFPYEREEKLKFFFLNPNLFFCLDDVGITFLHHYKNKIPNKSQRYTNVPLKKLPFKLVRPIFYPIHSYRI